MTKPDIDKILSEASEERLWLGIIFMMAQDRDDEMLIRQIELFVDTEINDYPDEIVTMDDVLLFDALKRICNKDELGAWASLLSEMHHSNNLPKKEQLRKMMWTRIGATHLPTTIVSH